MKKKFNWVIKSKHILIIMILVCLSLMALAAAVNLPAGPVKNIVGYAVIPFQKGINSIGTALDDATAGLQSKQKLVEENQQLQDKVDELTAQNSQLTQDLDELDRLQELYNLDQQYSEYDKVAAQVIAMDDENWFSTFTINRGTDDGVQVDCNVITEGGLVGIVTEAGKSWATVRSIIDDSSNVSAMTMSTSDRCIVAGDLRLINEGKLQFIHLKDDDDRIQEGEKIITSDVSEKFLPGILIGYVSEIQEDPNNLTKTGTLTPVVDFEHIREVLVIKELKQQKGDSYMRIRRKLAYILVILFCFILQTTVFQRLAIGSIVPNLLLIATVSFGFMRGKITGIWAGFLCGILKDIFYGNLLGFYALIYLCIGYGAGCCTKIFYDEEIRVPMFLVTAGDIIYGLAVYGFQFLLRGRTDILFYIRRIIIPEAIYTVLITVVLYKLLFILNKKLTELEMKERDSFWLRK